MTRTLRRLSYAGLTKADKGVVRRFVAKVTGLSRAQSTRLIGQYQNTGHIRDRRCGATRPFERRYTAVDIRLLAEVDETLGGLCGPTTRRVRVCRTRGAPAKKWLLAHPSSSHDIPCRQPGSCIHGNVLERSCHVRNRVRENRSLGSVRGEVGNDLAYSASQMDQSLLAHHGRVAAVAVGVQRPGEPCEQAFGDIAGAGRVILEQHDGRFGSGVHTAPRIRTTFGASVPVTKRHHCAMIGRRRSSRSVRT